MIMLMYGAIMLAGIIVGAKCHSIPKESRLRSHAQTAFLFTLLFVLGHQFGSDDAVAGSMSQMGLYGAVLSIAVMTGSFSFVLLLRTLIEGKEEDAGND
jgi:uncharacterized membrane protein YbjE (DUF340 family)